MKRKNLTPEVIVVCGQRDTERYKKWTELLLAANARSVAVFNTASGGFVVSQSGKREQARCSWEEVVGPVAVVLVHQADSGYWRRQVAANKVFWFDTPGTPDGEEGDFKVFRTTGASSFEVTEEDCREILDFGRGVRPYPPSCCTPKRTQSYIPAVAVLCQGYLAVYAKESATSNCDEVREALRVMGWRPDHAKLVRESLVAVKRAKWWLTALSLPTEGNPKGGALVISSQWESLKSAVSKEWGGPLDADVETLLRRMGSRQPILAPDVARAYLAIWRHLTEARTHH